MEICESTTQKTNTSTFRFKGSLFTLTVMQIMKNELSEINSELQQVIARTPNFFRQIPLVIDVQHLTSKQPLPLAELVTMLRKYQVIPVGIRARQPHYLEAAKQCGLAILPLSQGEHLDKDLNQTLPEAENNEKPKPKKPVKPLTGKLITQPVRSGQQIYARGSDLIIMSSVSHGAELLADGHIHIYGKLRGRALAGVCGDTNARIFCQSLDPELIAIAGHYQVKENLKSDDIGTAVQIYLDKERLRIVPLR